MLNSDQPQCLRFERSVITDYIPKWSHPTARKVFDWLLKLATLVVGVGFYEFETNDVGLTEGIKRIWKAGSTDKVIRPA
jgi:succinate dehydrogenase (ubiquinone) membrane anchor subunit